MNCKKNYSTNVQDTGWYIFLDDFHFFYFFVFDFISPYNPTMNKAKVIDFRFILFPAYFISTPEPG